MSFANRKSLYARWEANRKKSLIVYATSIRSNCSAQMASDAITEIIEQVQLISEDHDEIDFLIISNGGDPITALRVVTMLRERFKKISVVVPYVAFSAATILALGADEIIMHPYSNLGPVDPQLSVIRQNGIGQSAPLNFSSEDIRNYIEFIKTDVGITDQAQLITAFNSLATEVGSIPIGASKRSQQLSLSLSIKMLETHMEDKNKASSIAKALNTSYYHHGYAVGRQEALEIGLDINFPDKELESIMWDIWLDFCAEMKCQQAFDPISEIMGDSTARNILSSAPVVSLPLNTPPNVAQNIIGQLAQQAAQVLQQAPIETSLLMASIESVRKGFSIRNDLSISYWRDANMAIAFNITAFSSGWVSI